MADTVGFIGLGIMGRPMAENLIEAGYDLVAYNRTREKAEELDGATVADTPREVAEQSDIIITMLPDSPAGRGGARRGRRGARGHQGRRPDRGHEHDLTRRHRGAFREGRGEGRFDARRAGQRGRCRGHRRDALHHGRWERGGLRAGASALRGHGRDRYPRRACRDGAGRQGGQPDRGGAHHRGGFGGARARLQRRGCAGEDPGRARRAGSRATRSWRSSGRRCSSIPSIRAFG